RIHGLVVMIADGEKSEYMRTMLHDFEAQAKAEKAAIEELERQAEAPIRLPSPDEVLKRVFELEKLFAQDPTAGREPLARYFKDGKIRLQPQPDGVYLAKSELLPLVALLEGDAVTSASSKRERRLTARVAGARFELATFGL